MKVLVVANANSTHTLKWCLALKEAGCRVALFSIDGVVPGTDWFVQLDTYYVSPHAKKKLLNYFPLLGRLRRMIKSFGPDVLHSHFLTNYTLLAHLTGFRKHVATAWGSDVYLYARKNFLTRSLVKYNIKKAQAVVSTSFGMAEEIKKLYYRHVSVIPFGIDLEKFKPGGSPRPDTITIACFKHLREIYAPQILVEAFSIVCNLKPGLNLRLLLAGDGPMRKSLEVQVAKAGITGKVEFAGWVEASKVPLLMEKVDMCVYLSNEESFGVSLLEAMACRKPLVVTPTIGFQEVAAAGGALFCRFGDPHQAAEQIIRLIEDRGLAEKIAAAGYEIVKTKYDLRKNITDQVALYKNMLKTDTKL